MSQIHTARDAPREVNFPPVSFNLRNINFFISGINVALCRKPVIKQYVFRNKGLITVEILKLNVFNLIRKCLDNKIISGFVRWNTES